MGKLKQWLIRRFIVNRLKAFFGGLLKPTTSEFWLGWSATVMKVLCVVSVGACAWIDSIAQMVGFPTGEVLIATLLAITIGRMTSKAAGAELSSTKLEAIIDVTPAGKSVAVPSVIPGEVTTK